MRDYFIFYVLALLYVMMVPIRHACNYAISAELAFFYDDEPPQKHLQQRCSFRHAYDTN
ncbi:hypothetical protein BDR06DRAFT_15214 [Suillus hirtellus]|nr:hypothetical protein BDR06DRAFT_15214 [Suillus hirtellus]